MIGIWGAEVKQHMHQEHELITPIEKISGRLVGSINAFSDFCLLSLPLCCLYKLEIKKKDKVALYVTFLLGLIATAASITRASLFDKNPRTIPWMNRELCGFDYWYHIDMITMSLETSTGLLAANLGSLYYVFIISGIPRAWYEAVMGKVQTRRGRALLQASDSSTQPSTRVYTDASFESIQVVDLKMSS
ncbi:hypothetical protein CC78DRAFT_534187 [Lojkania enalia]|uniref:Rhodopsin domain-containing protein n=1 Tax=Lojkania enalia TaxID=147567 RepID=A0A9P4MZ12_9PLEO|nr:hypothetical protein CC78DRAFT_534187 [Didymosphaeria enalia]